MAFLSDSKFSSLHWYHWFILTLSLLLTLTAWYITKQQSEEKIQLRFKLQVDQATTLILERMQKYEDALWAGTAMVQTLNGDVSRSQWKNYYNNLDIDKKYPGINGLGIIHNVHPEKLNDYLAYHSTFLPRFNVHPKHDIPDFWPITYIEPEGKNSAAIGLDITHETNRYTAALKARDTGLAQITGPIVLVQDQNETSGFLFYAPFYKHGQQLSLEDRIKNVDGLVYAPFIVNKLMQGTLNQDNRHIGIRISDKGEIIYNENQVSDRYYDKKSNLETNFSIEIYGRKWEFYIRSNLLGKEFSSSKQPLLILVSGILIDGLLMALFLVLARSNQHSVNYAKEVTKDLEKQNQQLNFEIEERKRLTIEAEKATKAKTIFLSNMSHELRTPLNAVTGLINICLKTSLDEKQTDYLQKAKLASSTLLSLINQTLDYSKIESGKLEIDNVEFNLCDLLHKIHAIFSIKATTQKVSFDIEIPPSFPELIIGDPLRIEQILLNLCSNAFKFTAKGEVRILVNYTFKAEDIIAVDVIVSDTGVGIAEKNMVNLFESFKQADASTTRKYGGTGLGLTISKQLVELMKGNISVTSKVNEGSRFCVHLEFPFVANNNANKINTVFTALESTDNNQKIASEDENLNIDRKMKARLKETKILLVEDIEVNQMIARMILEEHGATVVVANDGINALEVLSQNTDFDIILMDIQMPRMDGYETTQKILENKNVCHIPVIAMTANAVLSDIERCNKMGMKGHIAKPLEEEDILEKIGNCLVVKE